MLKSRLCKRPSLNPNKSPSKFFQSLSIYPPLLSNPHLEIGSNHFLRFVQIQIYKANISKFRNIRLPEQQWCWPWPWDPPGSSSNWSTSCTRPGFRLRIQRPPAVPSFLFFLVTSIHDTRPVSSTQLLSTSLTGERNLFN